MAIDFSKQFSPRRGSKTTMATTKKDYILAAGELFFEYPDTGIGTGACKVKLGDGVTTYENLEYAIENDTSGSAIYFDPDTSTTVSQAIGKVVSGAHLNTIVAASKKAVELLNAEVVKEIEIDGVEGTLTNNKMTFTTPDYTVGTVSSASGANVVLTPASGYGKTASSFGVKSTDGTISVAVTDGALDLEIGTIAGAASTIIDTNLDASMAVVSNASGKVAVSTVTASELAQLSGIDTTQTVQAQLDDKSAVGHHHDENDIDGFIDVAKLYGGANSAGHKIDLALIPQGALETLYIAADEAALRQLTSAQVQNGDVVKVMTTAAGGSTMYFVTNDQALPVGSGDLSTAFEEFSVGTASAVEWTNVLHKPDSVTTAFVGASTTADGAMGLVPAPTSADTEKYLAGDGTWTALPGAFQGATPSAAGEIGFVPAPTTADVNKYLMGNGYWTDLPVATSAQAGIMSAEDFNAVALVKAGVYDFGDEH